MAQSTTSKKNASSTRNKVAQVVADNDLSATEAAVECVKQYAKERPEVVAWCAFGIGFVLGWKLKPW